MTAESSGGGMWHVAPKASLALPSDRKFGGDQPEQIEFEDAFAGEATDPFGDAVSNSMYSESILRSFIGQADEETKGIIEACTTRAENGHRALDGDRLLKELASSDRATEYAQTLFGTHRKLRADFVHRYLRAMVSDVPIEQRIKTPVGERGERMASEVGKRATGGLLLPRDQAAAEHRAYSDAHYHNQ
jgi:hypothetical protein